MRRWPRAIDGRAQLGHAFGKARSGPMQPVGVHDVDLPVAHRRHAAPAGPGVEPRRPRGAIGAGDDRLGPRRDHRLHRHLRRRQRERGEHVLAAARGDRLADQVPAADRVGRLAPDLVEDARPSRDRRHPPWRPPPAPGTRRAAVAATGAVPASAPSRSMSAAMPSIVCGSVVNTAMPRAASLPTCAGVVYGHVTTRSGSHRDDPLDVDRVRRRPPPAARALPAGGSSP